MNLDKNTYLNYLSIKNNLFFPLTKFLNNEEIIEICKNYTFKKKFFPIPIFLSANKNDLKSIKNGEIKIFFKKKFIDKLKIVSISTFDKGIVSNLLFKNNNKKQHPFRDYLFNSGDYLIETNQINDINVNLNKKNNLIGFATRNIPHLGHEKIILKFVKNRNMLIHIMEDASNNKKISSSNTLRAYKKFIKKNKIEKKIILKKISAPSFLLGPRQAALHTIIAKNLSCKSFIIGRDHSGYKNFYGEFESYDFCKKNEKRLGIKIEASGSPQFCLKCNKIVFRNECKCKKNCYDISSTLIRNITKKNEKKKITNFL